MTDRINLGVGGEGVRGIDVFPDISDEIDRRIIHSEQRIKTWVLGGIAANLLVAILAAIPTIFYLGQMSRDISQTQQQLILAVSSLKENDSQIRDIIIWRARMEERDHDKEEVKK